MLVLDIECTSPCHEREARARVARLRFEPDFTPASALTFHIADGAAPSEIADNLAFVADAHAAGKLRATVTPLGTQPMPDRAVARSLTTGLAPHQERWLRRALALEATAPCWLADTGSLPLSDVAHLCIDRSVLLPNPPEACASFRCRGGVLAGTAGGGKTAVVARLAAAAGGTSLVLTPPGLHTQTAAELQRWQSGTVRTVARSTDIPKVREDDRMVVAPYTLLTTPSYAAARRETYRIKTPSPVSCFEAKSWSRLVLLDIPHKTMASTPLRALVRLAEFTWMVTRVARPSDAAAACALLACPAAALSVSALSNFASTHVLAEEAAGLRSVQITTQEVPLTPWESQVASVAADLPLVMLTLGDTALAKMDSVHFLSRPQSPSQATCAICLDEDADCAALTACGHRFCAACAIRHVATGAQACPLCRGDISNTQPLTVHMPRESTPSKVDALQTFLQAHDGITLAVLAKKELVEVLAARLHTSAKVLAFAGAAKAATLRKVQDEQHAVVLAAEADVHGLDLCGFDRIVFVHPPLTASVERLVAAARVFGDGPVKVTVLVSCN